MTPQKLPTNYKKKVKFLPNILKLTNLNQRILDSNLEAYTRGETATFYLTILF